MTMEPNDLELAGRAMTVPSSAPPRELEAALDRANDFAKAEKAANTASSL
jgi:hypothetical protein